MPGSARLGEAGLGEARNADWCGMARRGRAGHGEEQGSGCDDNKRTFGNDNSMKMKRYEITMTGVRPLLLHADNLVENEKIRRWQKDPKNRDKSVPGDDRTPAWTWMSYLYVEGGTLILPSDNLMTLIREGAKRISTGKRGTFKSQSQSGIMVDGVGYPILVNGTSIKVSQFTHLVGEDDFLKHEETATSLGFNLFVKRAKVGTAKHVRVRPKFDKWSAVGQIMVFEDSITSDVVTDIFNQAGQYAGIGDWRPSSPKSPGPFGTFTAAVKEVKS